MVAMYTCSDAQLVPANSTSDFSLSLCARLCHQEVLSGTLLSEIFYSPSPAIIGGVP